MPRVFDEIQPYWQTADEATVRLYHGHVLDVLRSLPTGSVHCVVTSPPYWGLRDYGTGTWEGGDPECDHGAAKRLARNLAKDVSSRRQGRTPDPTRSRDGVPPSECACGARRIDQQLGSEPSPDCGRFRSPVLETLLRDDLTDAQRAKALELAHQLSAYLSPREPCGRCFVCSMVGVFREVRRVLRNDGTMWLNLGDSYSSSPPGNKGTAMARSTLNGAQTSERYRARLEKTQCDDLQKMEQRKLPLSSGNLVGVPWRVALALQADGWVLRQDIIWAKPAPMPESVRNRCTKAHEYVFLLTKRMGYYYDAEAVKERAIQHDRVRHDTVGGNKYSADSGVVHSNGQVFTGAQQSNRRSVWTVPKPLMKLRDDLTPDQKDYVLGELVKRGLL